MTVRHQLIKHQDQSFCGLSIFIEGKSPAATVVVTDLPDNPGVSARDSFSRIARKVKGSLLRNLNGKQIVWAYRQQGDSVTHGQGLEIAKINDAYEVNAWERVGDRRLGSIVNRDGGFIRQSVFIPMFRPIAEGYGRRRQGDCVNYVCA